MIQQRLCSLINNGNFYTHIRTLTTSPIINSTIKFRLQKGLCGNANRERLMRDSPDYTFLDGRLTPFGTRQKQRILQEKQTCEDIVDLSGEIDFAIERHNQVQIQKENKRKNILNRKLKQKGVVLLNEK